MTMRGMRFAVGAAHCAPTPGLVHLPEWQVPVSEPTWVGAAARRWAFPGRFANPVDVSDCRDVRLYNFPPHSECKKNMRGHVLSMSRVGRDLRVDSRRAQAERRVRRIVVTM